jgi:diguanylate cyclase (GGDEF)-like protein
LNTDVLKRKDFFSKLGLLTKDALHSTRQHGLIILDIDAFRFVNARSGYTAGDHLINLLEQHLMRLLPYGDIGANLGAGSFAILIPNAELIEIKALECSLRQSVREREFRWQEKTFYITLSSGATMLLDSDDDESVSFSRAELALFQAKQQGNDCMKFAHAPKPTADVPISSWASKIQYAFLHDGFRLWVQPVIDTASNQAILIDVSYTLDVDGKPVPLHVV